MSFSLNENLPFNVVRKAKDFQSLYSATRFVEIAEIQDVPYIYGHIPINISHMQMEPVFGFTYLRDPIQLAVSYFYYAKRLGLIDLRYTLSDFIRSEFKWSLSNQQVRWLADSKIVAPNTRDSDTRTITEVDLNLAKESIDNFDFIGLVERYDESTDCLLSSLGFNNVKFGQLNIGDYCKDLSGEDISLLKDLNEADLYIYEYAKSRFTNKPKKVTLGSRLRRNRHFVSPYRLFVNIADSPTGIGLYSKEVHPDHGIFKWCTDLCQISLDVNIRKRTNYTLKICLVNSVNYDRLGEIKLLLNSIEVNFSISLDSTVGFISANVTFDEDIDSPILSIIVPFANRPPIIIPDQTDDRILGIALSWIYFGVADEVIEFESQLGFLIENSGVGFGTSGARGLVSAMTDTVCQAYVSAFLQAVTPQANRIVLGCDLRPSSPTIARSCAAAIKAAGREVLFAGILPTPALAFYGLQHQLPAVMVTGSHIPFDRNGIKFYRADGEISKADEAAMMATPVPAETLPPLADLPTSTEVLATYLERYRGFFPPGFLAGKRIGVYEHSSVARDVLGELLRGFGATVVSLGRTDEFVPVDTEAVSEADRALAQAWATEHRLDAILSTDGDADRPLLADERGQWLRGDIVGLLCARYLDARVVATPVSCNTAIERCGAFDRVVRTRIGSPYVVAAMEAALAEGEQGVVGFEANGGFLVGDAVIRQGRRLAALPTRDALLPMLALLAQAAERGVPLSALSSDLPARFTASDRIKDFPTEKSRALLVRLAADQAAVAAWLGEDFATPVAQDETDGLRLTFANGEIVHLRPSGNAPELRCYAEAESEVRAGALVRWGLGRV